MSLKNEQVSEMRRGPTVHAMIGGHHGYMEPLLVRLDRLYHVQYCSKGADDGLRRLPRRKIRHRHEDCLEATPVW